ncbi:MAG: deoxyribodipyrimidine photo-lyase, partial [Mariniphaga sp.]|nr:deoxyribodipyrimidine photo-lyase [Mariniphaga sp.]
MIPVNLFWFRRDLRLNDNHGLFHALQSGLPTLPVFIFDSGILDKLEYKNDARVSFVYAEVLRIKVAFEMWGSSLKIFHGIPLEIFRQITREYEVKNVFTNVDYEPYALERDRAVERFLNSKGIDFHAYKDHVIFDKNEIVKENGTPYTVFTPYSRKWKQVLEDTVLS